jgi:hypothetical protein
VEIKKIHLVLDNLRMHKGKQVQAWLPKHERFVFHQPMTAATISVPRVMAFPPSNVS